MIVATSENLWINKKMWIWEEDIAMPPKVKVLKNAIFKFKQIIKYSYMYSEVGTASLYDPLTKLG